MLPTLLLLLAGADGAEGATGRLLADHRRLTTVAVRCPERAAAGEVVVCGRRMVGAGVTTGGGGARLLTARELSP